MPQRPIHIETPLLESLPLSRRLPGRVWLKLEALQPCGSFKARGIGFACQRHRERGCTRFVASSGGNAGLVVAHAGRRLGVAVTVVVPRTTAARAQQWIRDESAEVVVFGDSWQEAHEHALTLLDADSAYIHPFDDSLLWEGHATLIDEVVAAGLRPDAVVLSIGGGGLLIGVARGLERARLTQVPILTAETTGTASFHASLEAGERVELPRVSGVATSLGARQVAAQAFEIGRRLDVRPHVVSDREAIDACLSFADDHRVVVEPACGASLALAYAGVPALRDREDVLLIVCGGAGVSHADLVAMRDACEDSV